LVVTNIPFESSAESLVRFLNSKSKRGDVISFCGSARKMDLECVHVPAELKGEGRLANPRAIWSAKHLVKMSGICIWRDEESRHMEDLHLQIPGGKHMDMRK
jgi:hypothetical protein